jgi:23S rRNA (uridine2552-2'-O)-methyltransferase
VEFIQGDFSEKVLEQELVQRIGAAKVDWVISDMAPNFSGMNSVDIPRMIELAELALSFALSVLNDQGGFLVKTFYGEGFDSFLLEVRRHFKKVVTRKPKASRGRSNEVYILAKK